MKKYLKAIITNEITGLDENVVDALKQLWRATYEKVGEVSFEVVEYDEFAVYRELNRRVANEFTAGSEDAGNAE